MHENYMIAFILKWADKHIHKSENDSETSLIALSQVLRNSFSLVYNTEFDVFAKNFIRVAVVGNKYLIRSHFNLWTYWGGWGGGGWIVPLLRVFYMLQYFETILPLVESL